MTHRLVTAGADNKTKQYEQINYNRNRNQPGILLKAAGSRAMSNQKTVSGPAQAVFVRQRGCPDYLPRELTPVRPARCSDA